MAIPEVQEATAHLRKDFCKKEAPYLEISDQDFFSLVMMTPTIGIALANGSISLFEEIALNKKARKLSKGGYFMKKDPVVYAMKYLIKKYDTWCESFFSVLKIAINQSLDLRQLENGQVDPKTVSYSEYKKAVLGSPYILIRFIASFFLENDEDIINDKRRIGRNEYLQILKIGEYLGLQKVGVFQMFCYTFDQRP